MSKAKKRRRQAEATAELETAERHEFSAGMLGHDAGNYHVNVSESMALAVDVVYACVRTLCDAVADARWGEWDGTNRLPESRLTRRPMATWTRRRWLWRVTATMALYNVCHLERVGDGGDGSALSLRPLVPGQLSRMPGGRLLIDGRREVSPDRIRTLRRADWPSVTEDLGTVLRLARQTFAAAWAADAYRTDYWEHGGAPAVILTTDQAINNTTADDIRDRWVARRTSEPGAPAVLGHGTEAKAFGADIAATGADASLERLGAAVARFIGMPTWLVNVASAAGSMVYANTESAGLDLVRFYLRGYLGPIEDELSDELPGDYLTDRRVALDVSHLTVGSMLERAQSYQIATGGRPWMQPAEVRAELHLPPDRDLDPNGAPAPALERIPTEVP